MYKVDSNFQFINHFTSSKEIADAVISQLLDFGCEHPELIVTDNVGDIPVFWDPGGVLMLNDETFVFHLDNISIELYKQYFEHFVSWTNNAVKHEVGGVSYYIIHSGYLNCICITENELMNLKDQLKDPTLKFIASESIERKNSVSNGLFTQAIRVKDKDGNISIAKIKQKEPVLN